MKITLEEAFDLLIKAPRGQDGKSRWEEFCDLKGFTPYVVKEGGGHLEVSLTIEEARKFGIVR